MRYRSQRHRANSYPVALHFQDVSFVARGALCLKFKKSLGSDPEYVKPGSESAFKNYMCAVAVALEKMGRTLGNNVGLSTDSLTTRDRRMEHRSWAQLPPVVFFPTGMTSDITDRKSVV